MGACGIDDLSAAFVEGMIQLCTLHPSTGVGDTGEYLSPAIDKQVGLGMLGLANFLANEGVSYEDFGKALEAYLSNDLRDWETKWVDTIAGHIVWKLGEAIEDAEAVARGYGMDRAFCIAPTASCSYRYLDKKGFTTTPEIAPPIARTVDRDSGTFGVESFDYGEVEIAEEVGWENYLRAVNGLVSLYQETGLFHGYSFNSWSDVVVYDRAFLQDWLESSQTSLYYSLQVLSDTQRKDDAYAALDDSFKSMFGLDDSEVIEETVACDIEAAFCAACAE
jgi:hypothetical protein